MLPGMNSASMVEENARTAADTQTGSLTEEDLQMISSFVRASNARMKVGCTGCGYCTPCPFHVDIPGTFAAYNRRYAEGKFWALVDYAMCTALRKTPMSASNCTGCGKCEKHCPQQIPIRQELKAAREELEVPIYRLLRYIVQKINIF